MTTGFSVSTPPTPHRPVEQAALRNRPFRGLRHWLLAHAALTLGRARPRLAEGSFGILMYHRVTDRVLGVPFPTWNVTPQRLRRQLAGLLGRGYRPWPLRRALHAHAAGRPVPRQVFVVTFDDGYANNASRALPVLRELNVPATVFIATAYLDSSRPFPSDDWSAAGSDRAPREAWRPLRTDECRAMMESGLIEIGTHTHTHRDFRGRPDALREDLAQSLDVLRERFGLREVSFAFPYGTKSEGFSGPLLARAAREAGVSCSLTTESELARSDESPFHWGRFTVAQWDTAATLAAKLDGRFNTAREAWRSLVPRHVGQDGSGGTP